MSKIFLQMAFAISRYIANYGYDVDFWFKRYLDAGHPESKINDLTFELPKYIYT